MLINTQFHLSNLLGLSHGWTISISFIYTELLVWASYSDTNYLSEHQMCPSSILPLGLFQGIIGNIERLKEESLESWITGGTLDPSLYSMHAREMLFASLFL